VSALEPASRELLLQQMPVFVAREQELVSPRARMLPEQRSPLPPVSAPAEAPEQAVSP
jgi:hypothetical protein